MNRIVFGFAVSCFSRRMFHNSHAFAKLRRRKPARNRYSAGCNPELRTSSPTGTTAVPATDRNSPGRVSSPGCQSA